MSCSKSQAWGLCRPRCGLGWGRPQAIVSCSQGSFRAQARQGQTCLPLF